VTPVLATSSVDNWTALVLGAAIVVFLFVALLWPEKL